MHIFIGAVPAAVSLALVALAGWAATANASFALIRAGGMSSHPGLELSVAASSNQPAKRQLANDTSETTTKKDRAAAKRALRDAEDAARREAERETQRRLDQMIMQQLLRDAARP
jgi:hypothetical protein